MSSQLRSRLEAAGIRPKKGLGQNFLHDPHALATIAKSVGRDEPKSILEIGPGPGALTEHLSELGVPLVAVEKDATLVRFLRDRFQLARHVEILEGDILTTAIPTLFPAGARPSVVGNIPYNISSPIVIRLVEQRRALGSVTLMLQAELAQRLRAPVGSREAGSLTVMLALVAEVRRELRLPPAAFWPRPKVHSEVIQIAWRPDVGLPPGLTLQDVETTVRAGFGQRRKTLRNALRRRWPDEVLHRAALRAGIDLSRRGESLALADWVALASALQGVEAGETG